MGANQTSQSRGLLWVYFITTSLGFACAFCSTILPYWFAKLPSSPATRFLRLGLWEVCFANFIAHGQHQQRVYDGCFYLFDEKLRPLWSQIFNAWFHTAQTLQVVSLLLLIILIGLALGWFLGAVDVQKPSTVMCSIVMLALFSWLVLTTLGVVGVCIDLEKKKFRARGFSLWLSDLEHCGLSWSYGLAAFSLLWALVSLNILAWCVYPRKEPGGRLTQLAWSWPDADELPCCVDTNDYYQDIIVVPRTTNDNYAANSSTVQSSSVNTRASYRLRQRILQENHEYQKHCARQSPTLVSTNTTPFPQLSHSSVESSLNTYDPRSTDAVSVDAALDELAQIDEVSVDLGAFGSNDNDEWAMIRKDPRRYVDPHSSIASRQSVSRSQLNSIHGSSIQFAHSMHEPRRTRRLQNSGSVSTNDTYTLHSARKYPPPIDANQVEYSKIIAKPMVPK